MKNAEEKILDAIYPINTQSFFNPIKALGPNAIHSSIYNQIWLNTYYEFIPDSEKELR